MAFLRLALCAVFASAGPPQEELLRPGDRIALVGNALAERTTHDGWLESALACAFPELRLSLRNLGFSGDEFDVRQRTDGFGTPEEWLERVEADVVFAFFGYGESFRGDDALARLADDFGRWLEGLRPRRVVVFSALPREAAKGRALPDPGPFDARVLRVNAAMARACAAQGVRFVDLYAPMERTLREREGALTVDGVHLTSEGNRLLADVVLRELWGGAARAADAATLERVRALVLEKGALWFQRYQATDGYNVYGGRSSLSYTEEIVDAGGGQEYAGGLSNFEVLQRELEQLDAACAHLDARIHAAALGSARDSAPLDPPVLPAAIPVPTNRPGPHEFLDAEAAIARMQLAPGLAARLFASEERFPELANPVQMAFDPRGRLWVAAWPSYPHPTPQDPLPDRLLIVEDDDRDGRADRVEVFADGLANPTGFEFWNGGVLLASCPDLLFLKDTDGDDRCDVRERVLHGLSSADTHHSANSLVLGPEGALYFQEGVFHRSQVESIFGVIRNRDAAVWRFDPRTFRVERWVAYGFANPHGHVFDRWGSDFVTDGTGNQNYDALPISGELDPPQHHPGIATIFAQRSRPAAATEILSSAHFPPEYQGDFLVANVIGFQGVFRYELEPNGSTIRGREETPILFSSDPNFRPVDLEVGPDGALWLLDWQAPLIGHMQHHLRDPSRDHEHGRVYRVVCEGRPLAEPAPIAGAPLAALLELLASPEDRVRYRARIELSARPSADVVAAARAWARTRTDAHERLEALWLQSQHGVLDLELARGLLADAEPRARAAAVRVVRHLRRLEPTAEALCARAVLDEHPRVRLEGVVALASFPSARAAESALRVLDRELDATLEYALGETLRQLSPHWRGELAAGRPFAAAHPAGLAHALARLDDEELAGVAPGPALFRERLARPGATREEALAALDGLAAANTTGRIDELVAAIERADARDDAHADHVLGELFELARELARPPLPDALTRLVASAARGSTRRLALAQCLEEPARLSEAWSARAADPAALAELLEAGAHVASPESRAELARRAGELLAAWRPADSSPGTRARFVRVELPGPARTLTLAEVEVESGGENVARGGRASQSSVAWGGSAERAVDGNKDGAYGAGGQTHTVEDQPDPWWEVDLGRELALERVRLWNRTEGDFAARLDGFVVRALDAERRETFVARGGEAGASVEVELGAGDAAPARAAARLLATLAPERADTLERLIARWDADALRPALVRALRSIPLARWPDARRADMVARLRESLASEPGASAETWALAEELAASAELAASPEGDAARALLDLCQRARPKVVVLRPVPDAMLFDAREIAVLAGRPIELTFENVDLMPHNWVLAAIGALARVGLAAEAMAADPDAGSRHFVPSSPDVLQATRLLQPGESQTLAFRAPAVAGDYPFVCTFPGHWTRMNGVLRVAATPEELARIEAGVRERAAAGAASPAATSPARRFVREWQLADLAGDLARVRAASAERGRALVEQASCLKCHADGAAPAGAPAPRTGPALADAVAAHAGARELLQSILEPSARIREGFESELFFLRDERVVAGRVVASEPGLLLVLDDPYRDDLLELPLADVAERRANALSTMPSGLLSTFRREEILDLVAYLESLRR